MRYVVLPQAFNVVVPPTTNYSIALLKDTAVVSAVAAPEIMFRARNLVMETYLSAQIYLLVAAMYLVHESHPGLSRAPPRAPPGHQRSDRRQGQRA